MQLNLIALPFIREAIAYPSKAATALRVAEAAAEADPEKLIEALVNHIQVKDEEIACLRADYAVASRSNAELMARNEELEDGLRMAKKQMIASAETLQEANKRVAKIQKEHEEDKMFLACEQAVIESLQEQLRALQEQQKAVVLNEKPTPYGARSPPRHQEDLEDGEIV